MGSQETIRGGTQTDTEEELILMKLFTPEAARRLSRRMHADYETFGFPKEPAWVVKATGKWYDKPAYAQGNAKRRRLSLEEDEDDDDLVELARQTGYLEL